MSSILKALKRLEQEKAVRRPHELNVDAEIIRGVHLQRRTPLLVVIVAAVALFVGGGGAVYLLVKPAALPSPGVGAIIPQAAPRIEAIPQPSAEPAPTPVEKGVMGSQDTMTRPAAPNVPQKSTPPPPTSTPAPQSAPRNIPVQKLDTAQPLPEPAPPVQPSQPAESKKELRLDGIAFQDGGGESLAVINGKTVTRGATVDGARVEEIQRDRVKLSRGGERFEIILDRSN